MNKNYGKIVEQYVKASNCSIDDLALKLRVNKRSIYNWFDTEDLRGDIIYRIGCVIDHDFATDFPEIFNHTTFDSNYSPAELKTFETKSQLTKIYVIDDSGSRHLCIAGSTEQGVNEYANKCI